MRSTKDFSFVQITERISNMSNTDDCHAVDMLSVMVTILSGGVTTETPVVIRLPNSRSARTTER